jgi:hypothetical protein
MSRPSVVLRDAALGYASRGIPSYPCTTHSPTGSASSPSARFATLGLRWTASGWQGQPA